MYAGTVPVPTRSTPAADIQADIQADIRADIQADIQAVAVAAVKPVDRPRSRPATRKAPLGQVVDLVAAHEADGGHVTDPELTVAVAAALRVSERTARRRLEPFRAGKVAPLTVAADSVGGAA